MANGLIRPRPPSPPPLVSRSRSTRPSPGRTRARMGVNTLGAILCFPGPGGGGAPPEGTGAPRLGPNRFSPLYPAAAYATADGWVGITCLTPPQWVSLCQLVGRPEAADDP